jgi:hypothetical protein
MSHHINRLVRGDAKEPTLYRSLISADNKGSSRALRRTPRNHKNVLHNVARFLNVTDHAAHEAHETQLEWF